MAGSPRRNTFISRLEDVLYHEDSPIYMPHPEALLDYCDVETGRCNSRRGPCLDRAEALDAIPVESQMRRILGLLREGSKRSMKLSGRRGRPHRRTALRTIPDRVSYWGPAAIPLAVEEVMGHYDPDTSRSGRWDGRERRGGQANQTHFPSVMTGTKCMGRRERRGKLWDRGVRDTGRSARGGFVTHIVPKVKELCRSTCSNL